MVSPSIFSFGSYFTSIVSCLLLTLLGCRLVKESSHAIYRELRLLVVFLVVSAFRLLLPINLPFSFSVYSEKILPPLTGWLFADIPSTDLMLYQCIGVAFALVSCVLLTITVTKYLLFYRQISIASRASKHLDDLVHSINPSVHLHARYIQTDISPFIMGFVRPVIVIPAGIYSDSELELVLRHEMIHYLERDSQVKLLLTFLTCIFWWNPLIYVVQNSVNDTLELSNDVRLTDSLNASRRIDYAQCIIHTARCTECSVHAAVIPFAHAESNIVRVRIKTILQDRQRDGKRLTRTMRWALILMPIIIILSFLIIPEPSSIDPETAATTFSLEDDLHMNPDNSFLIDQGDCYTLYIDGHKIGDLSHPDEEFENIRIFSTLEEASETMNITIKEDYDFNENGLPYIPDDNH